jgi:sugar transferase EpsL
MHRIFEILLVLATAPMWFSVLAVTAVVLRVTLGSPVFFLQRRAGYKGEPFDIIKFRTMTDARNEAGELLPDEKRLTKFGRWLRSTSLDEFPELINVLRGEMSLVGPRPLLVRYLDRYSVSQARRHDVKPGITGWAQINGRNGVSWDRKFELDVWYVDNKSLWLDIRILWLTVRQVLVRQGISADGEATMPEFLGGKGSTAERRIEP